MPKVAKTEPGVEIATEGHNTFRFGDDGTRQVTEAEADILRRYTGPFKIEIIETKAKGGKS